MDWVVLQRVALVIQTCSLSDNLGRPRAAKSAYMARAAQPSLWYECCLDSRVSEDVLTGDFKNLGSPFPLQCTAGPPETMTLSVPEQICEDLVLFWI